jgi:monofunctional biosynthetic peptidoglycan transglycosylase
MKAHIKKRLIKLLLLIATLLVLFSPLYMYFSHDVEALNRQYPHLVQKNAENEYVLREARPKNWVKLRHVSRFAKWAIVLSEDWAFYQHEGIDIEQLKTAIIEMLTFERVRGASTITQQMVKNVFLSSDRTITRKIHEFILAQKVEQVLTKDKILEAYLNCIEFGPDIYGIRAASYHYFKKHPSALNPREGAFLAMLLPSPRGYYTSFKNKKLTPFARKRVDTILAKMKMGKVLSEERYQREKGKKLSWERR